jgi:hypothetical protein
MRFLGGPGALAVLTFLAPSLSLAQTPTADDPLRRDIEALKEGQKAIQKDLEEIKRILQSRPVADALPKDPISLADEPFKGEPGAKVALIEFSAPAVPLPLVCKNKKGNGL